VQASKRASSSRRRSAYSGDTAHAPRSARTHHPARHPPRLARRTHYGTSAAIGRDAKSAPAATLSTRMQHQPTHAQVMPAYLADSSNTAVAMHYALSSHMHWAVATSATPHPSYPDNHPASSFVTGCLGVSHKIWHESFRPTVPTVTT
jgi:hypothetical protein